MTRETKIGLLVGLAFIIIVGILLSEPLNHAGEAQPAPLPYAGRNVLQSDAAPGSGNTQPPVSLQPDRAAAPTNPVPTREEVAKSQGGISIQIGSGAVPSHTQVTNLSNAGNSTGPMADRGTATAQRQQHQTQPKAPENPGPVASNTRDPLFDAANQVGEELVPVGKNGNATGNPKGAAASPTTGNKTYEAVPGDTLAKIAQKAYGSASKANRDAIVAANPSLKQDPNRLLAGQTYVIPAPASAAPAAQAVAKEAPAKTESAEYWYTVKAGDSLWAIARDQLGDTATVAAIKELNEPTLKGSDGVKVGMKLRLPAKPLASAD
jgi:nucleoid-associated protein YgaU